MNFDNMTLKEKVLQTFIVTIREINTHGGPEKFFSKYPVGGVYYGLTKKKEDGELGTGFTERSHLADCRRNSKYPLFVCADGVCMENQETEINPTPLGGSKNLEDAYNYGKIRGMQMNKDGVDWILMPSADMYYSREMPLLAISDDADLTAEIYSKVINGIQDQGVCATIKHFPGIGTCNVNMHFGPGKNILDKDEWMKTYGHIYKTAFDNGVMCVMTTHMMLESYASEKENGYLPIATFSKKITTDLLKNELGFKGAVVTDALIMGGMATGNLVEECVQAFRAGADFLLWPPVETADRIVELLESGEIPMSRLDDALTRINRMRTFREKALADKAYDEPSLEFVNNTMHKIIDDGMCLYRNNIGLIPIDEKKGGKILIVDITDEDDPGSSEMMRREFISRGFSADIKRDLYDIPSRVCWQVDIDKASEGYDYVIFNLNGDYATRWSAPFMLIWASHLFKKSNKIIVNHGSPFFADSYFPEDPTFIETNVQPCEYSIKRVVDGILGHFDFTATPVLTKKH